MHNPYPTEQVRQAARDRLVAQGVSVQDWAKKHKVKASTVYAVLNGQHQCLRGKAHRVAVLLGIKADPESPANPALPDQHKLH